MDFNNRQQELEFRHNLLMQERTKAMPPMPKAKTALAAVGVGAFATKSIWLDYSDYQPKVNLTKLAGRISGVMVKMFEVDDQAASTNFMEDGWANAVGDADAAGLPIIGWFMVNPAWYANNQFAYESVENFFEDGAPDVVNAANLIRNDPQIKYFVRALAIGSVWYQDAAALKDGRVKFRTVHGWGMDLERRWQKYNEWYTNPSTAPVVSDFWIGYTAQHLYEKITWLMDHGFLPKIPCVNYSSLSFVKEWSPKKLGTFLENKDSWCAGYYWSGSAVNTTIEEFRSKYLATVPNDWKPGLFGVLKFIQITGDKFKIPEVTNAAGAPVAVDINVSVHTQAEDYAWLGFTTSPVDPTPPPTPEPIPTIAVQVATVVNELGTNQRTEPTAEKDKNKTIVAIAPKDTQFYGVVETRIVDGDTWYKLSNGLWVAGIYKNKTYTSLSTVIVVKK